MFRIIPLIVILTISTISYAKETVWVTDKLYLGLHEKPNSSSKRIKFMKSGVKLEVLETKGRYSKVKTVSGKVGWAKAHLLINKPTATLELIELKKQYEAIEQDKLELSNQLKKNNQIESLKKQEFSKITVKLNQEKGTNAQLLSEIKQLNYKLQKEGLPKKIIIIKQTEGFFIVLFTAIVLVLLLMFHLGRWSFERKVREQLNGYKIW